MYVEEPILRVELYSFSIFLTEIILAIVKKSDVSTYIFENGKIINIWHITIDFGKITKIWHDLLL